MTGDDKGEWAEVADEGIVPDELSDEDESGPVGRTAETRRAGDRGRHRRPRPATTPTRRATAAPSRRRAPSPT